MRHVSETHPSVQRPMGSGHLPPVRCWIQSEGCTGSTRYPVPRPVYLSLPR